MENSKFSAFEFEYKINLFLNYINEITLKESDLSYEERRLKIIETLKFDQFFTKLRQIFGSDLNESFSKSFFKKICQNPDCTVDWSELFGYNLNDNYEKTDKKEDQNSIDDLLEEVQIFMAPYRFRIGDASGDKAKRDIIQFIHYAPDIDSFITVAQKGAVSIWNNKLKLSGCTFLKEQIDGWLNGCCFLPNLKRIVITAERSLTLWDFRNNKQNKSNTNMNLLTIQGMSALTCLDSINVYNQHKESDKLIVGDSFGNIMTFEININDLSSNNTKPDLIDPQKRVIETESFKHSIVKKKIHDMAVTKIKYIPELSSFISCSSSEKVSLVIEELVKFETKDVKINRQVGINKGLNTFCYCSKLNLIATGGVDKAIRLFNPLVLNKSCGKLLGHLFTIVDLVCNEKDQQLISLSSERVFRIWDLTTFKCLQVFSDTETRPGEKRIFCISFDQKRDRLLTCSSVLDCWPLTRSIQDTMLPTHTHDRPLVAISYSENQIATLCAESTLKVWEGDTGRLLYSIKNVHGPSIQMSCLKIDPTGNRLATAGSDGSIKIWNIGTGQELKSKNGKKVSDPSMRTVSVHYAYIKNELCLLVCDFSNIVRIYSDSCDSNELILLQVLSKSNRRDSILYKYDIIPPINNHIQHLESNETHNQPIFDNYQLSAMINHRINSSCYFHENNWLLTAHKHILIWDTVTQNAKHIFGVDPNETDSDKLETENLSESCKLMINPKINSIKILFNKKKKVEFSEKIIEYDIESEKNPKSCDTENNEGDDHSRKSSTISVDETNSPTEEDQERKEIEHDLKPKFKFLIITAHDNAMVKFWSEEGAIILEIPTINSIRPSPITSICYDQDRKFLYTGDTNGYLTIWSIEEFLNNFDLNSEINLSENYSKISMVICFRAHMSKIVDLIYIPQTKIVLSASIDESVRAWDALKGRYIGFLGQTKPLTKPVIESSDWIAPYDINEPPIYFNRTKVDKKQIEKKYEYPLILDKTRLKNKVPIEPTRSIRLPSISPLHSSKIDLNRNQNENSLWPNEKYFSALIKPKHTYNENEIQSRSSTEGSIFSSLPLYKETTSIDSAEFKNFLLKNQFRFNKDLTNLQNEKKQGPKVNFKTNVKVIK